MLILLGMTATGKTSVAKILEEKYGMKRVITWTTRPRRKNEIGGVDYNFCGLDDFKRLKTIGFFAETTSFVMADGQEVHYGTPIEELNGDKLLILNPEGFKKVNQLTCLDITSILITAPDDVIRKRLEERGDSKAEILRRMNADENDFYGIRWRVNNIVVNDDNKTLEDVAEEIMNIYRRK